MPTTDIATRVYNHTWKLDPIIRSLLDTDFYKLLMLQMIWGLYRDVQVTFSLVNRTTRVRIAEEVDERELRDQLDHARTLRFTKKEMIWLAGNTFYGRAQIFAPEFLSWLQNFQLSEYELKAQDGQYVLEFVGPWTHTTMWEIPALAIINELRSRAALRRLGRFTLDVLCARAKAKLWAKVERLARQPDLKISDFGTAVRQHEVDKGNYEHLVGTIPYSMHFLFVEFLLRVFFLSLTLFLTSFHRISVAPEIFCGLPPTTAVDIW